MQAKVLSNWLILLFDRRNNDKLCWIIWESKDIFSKWLFSELDGAFVFLK